MLYNGSASIANPNEWIVPSLSRGFTYNADGGAGGTGDGAIVDNPASSFNQKPRAVFYFADDDQQSTGSLDFELDVFLDDNTASNALQFLVEIYAWNDGQIARSCSPIKPRLKASFRFAFALPSFPFSPEQAKIVFPLLLPNAMTDASSAGT